MTPSARLQAAIEILEAIGAAPAAPDDVLRAYFRARRYAGSKDRRSTFDTVYSVLRHRARLDAWLAQSGIDAPSSRQHIIADLVLGGTDDIAQLFDGSKYAPAALDEAEASLVGTLSGQSLTPADAPEIVQLECPAWLEAPLRERFGDAFNTEMAALNETAAVDIRVNSARTDRDTVQGLLATDGIETEPGTLSPDGLRIQGRANLTAIKAFQEGQFEIQDEGSQIIAHMCAVKPGMTVVDYCAGAGGKALALAAIMSGNGRVIACDTVEKRLDRMDERLRRAKPGNIRKQLITENGELIIVEPTPPPPPKAPKVIEAETTEGDAATETETTTETTGATAPQEAPAQEVAQDAPEAPTPEEAAPEEATPQEAAPVASTPATPPLPPKADRVLVDAPCSGTGTWRRDPQARWRLTADDISKYQRMQTAILKSASDWVKPGGRLIYATCSLLEDENERVIDAFLENAPEFSVLPSADVWRDSLDAPCPNAGPYLHLTPASTGTDGYFAAVLERRK